MIAALRNPIVNASGFGMRTRLFTILVAFAVLWCGTGGPALACVFESPSTIVMAVDGIDQIAAIGEDDTERRSDAPGQAVSHHHCTMAACAVEPPFEAAKALEDAPAVPSLSASLTSFAQAPPVQPPAA